MFTLAVVCLGMLAVAGIHLVCHWDSVCRLLAATTGLALVGYALDAPLLYADVTNVATAVSLLTAVGFILLAALRMPPRWPPMDR